MKNITTKFQRTKDYADFNPALDRPLEELIAVFESDATSPFVPTGLVMLKFGELMEALDWHLYTTGTITMEQAREKIRSAAELMDKKFDIEYQKLPQ